MWTATFQHNKREKSGETGYKGIPIFAGYMLHEKSFEVFTRYVSDKKARILILGAGAGAFDQRLIDNGYSNILAVEYYKDIYVPKMEVVSRDLNEDFNDLGIFDVVIAIEIIEHIENQFHFMRQVNDLLASDGFALVTTPNVESVISRIKFFLRGYLSCFSPSEVTETGHINPVFLPIFRTHLKSIGLKLSEVTYSTYLWDFNQFSGFPQKFYMCIFRAISLIIKNNQDGQLSIFVCQKITLKI